MSATTFSQFVSNLRTMASGITTRTADLVSVSIGAADAAALEAFANELDSINSEQEELKAQLKTKTAELNDRMKEAKDKYAAVSRRVKAGTPQGHWKAFGITAKR